MALLSDWDTDYYTQKVGQLNKLGTLVNPYAQDTAYFGQKVSQLNKNAIQKPQQYGTGAWTAQDVQRAFTEAGLTPQQHYNLYGKNEGLVYNQSFPWTVPDVMRSFTEAGLTPQQHYNLYGKNEGLIYGQPQTQIQTQVPTLQQLQVLIQQQAQQQAQAQAEVARQTQIAKELEAQTMAQALAKLQTQAEAQARAQAQAKAQVFGAQTVGSGTQNLYGTQIASNTPATPALTREEILARDELIRQQTAAQVAQAQAQKQALPQISIPQTVFPSSSSAAYSGIIPTELYQILTPAVTQATTEVNKYMTPEGRAAMEAETRTGLLRGFRPKYEGQITQSLGQLAERGLLGGTTQENILRGVTADLSQQYDKEILNRVQERVGNYLNMIGGIGGLLKGTVQTAQESNPLAPYQLWADLVKGWLGAGA